MTIITCSNKIDNTTEKQSIFKNLAFTAEKIPLNVFWLDLDYRVIGTNHKTLESIGAKTRKEIIGKTIYEIYPEYIANGFTDDFNDLTHHKKDIKKERVIQDLSTGNLRFYLENLSTILDSYGNMIGIIGSSIEIFSKKEDAEAAFSPPQKSQIAPDFIKISNRELECIKLLKEGFSSKQIAHLLNISNRTVEQYIDTAKNKLGCKNSVELIYKCFKNGILH